MAVVDNELKENQIIDKAKQYLSSRAAIIRAIVKTTSTKEELYLCSSWNHVPRRPRHLPEHRHYLVPSRRDEIRHGWLRIAEMFCSQLLLDAGIDFALHL